MDERSSTERRATGERRRYNRRSVAEASPPYYDTFERIAVALEGIRDALAERRDLRPPAPRESGAHRGAG